MAGGFRVDPVGATDHHETAVLPRPLGGGQLHPADALDQQIGGVTQLPGQGGIENIGGGQALVNPAPGRPHVGGHLLKKGEDIVACAGLVFLNLAQIEFGAAADGAGVLGGDDFFPGHALTGQHLDFQPAAQLGFLGPDTGHRRAGITWDHRTCRVLIPNRFFKNSVPTYSVFLRKNWGRFKNLPRPSALDFPWKANSPYYPIFPGKQDIPTFHGMFSCGDGRKKFGGDDQGNIFTLGKMSKFPLQEVGTGISQRPKKIFKASGRRGIPPGSQTVTALPGP